MDRIDKIAEDVAFMRGQLVEHKEAEQRDRHAQTAINSRLLQLIEGNDQKRIKSHSRLDTRVRRVEEWKSGQKAVASVYGGISGTIVAVILKAVGVLP